MFRGSVRIGSEGESHAHIEVIAAQDLHSNSVDQASTKMRARPIVLAIAH